MKIPWLKWALTRRPARTLEPIQGRLQDRKRLSTGTFRELRQYLADDVFLTVPGGGMPPTDLVDEESWEGVMPLPTDVLLRTTDYQGRTFADTHDQWAAWVHATPMQPEDAPFFFDAALDASDEFHAAPFIAAHGWYRQATAGLRNALEAIAIAAALATRNDVRAHAAWRNGTYEPKFGNMVDLLQADARLAAVDLSFGSGGLFGRAPDGVIRDLYRRLSRYAHSAPGHTNVDIWSSSGPVWVERGFREFWIDFCDTVALCYVLGKLAWPDLELPDDAAPLFGAASPRWHRLGEAARSAYF